MKKNIFSLLFLFNLIVGLSMAQSGFDIPINHRVILSYPDLIIYADVLTDDPAKIKPDDRLFYHWYNANDIKSTRGGFDGKLLHGPYMEFYPNKNLKAKGNFRYGLKNGEWKSWYLTGELKEIVTWKKGKQHGIYKLFDKDGNLTEEGKFEKGCAEGKIKKYNKGECVTEKYKNGKVVEQKCRKKILDRFRKKKKKAEKTEEPEKNKKEKTEKKKKEAGLNPEKQPEKKPQKKKIINTKKKQKK